ncbi:plasmid mobilization protein [Aliarcobacter butzleri]
MVIYLTKEQKDEITKKAKQSSLSVSKYVMIKVFGIN